MPVMSFLAYPFRGKRESLLNELSEIDGCDVIPSIFKDAFVIVTERLPDRSNKALLTRLRSLESLEHLDIISDRTKAVTRIRKASEP